MRILPRSTRAFLLAATLFSAAPLAAQTTSSVNYWFTAGAGWAARGDDGDIAFDNTSSIVAAGTVQSGSLVASARWARADGRPGAAWDAGLLLGLGTPTRYAMRGSVAAGLGRINSPVGDGWTLPVELQLAWRLRPGVALGVYGFGSFTGETELLGASVALQLGHF